MDAQLPLDGWHVMVPSEIRKWIRLAHCNLLQLAADKTDFDEILDHFLMPDSWSVYPNIYGGFEHLENNAEEWCVHCGSAKEFAGET